MRSEREIKVLLAAREVFLRFGFRRSTMGDIAAGADLSRPALYLVFPNKEVIFSEVLLQHCEEAWQRSHERIEAAESLHGKLLAVLETWVVEAYEIISRSPEAHELHESSYSFAAPARERMLAMFEEQMGQVFKDSPEVDRAALERRGLCEAGLAGLAARAALGLKRDVEDVKELKRHLDTLILTLVAVLS